CKGSTASRRRTSEPASPLPRRKSTKSPTALQKCERVSDFLIDASPPRATAALIQRHGEGEKGRVAPGVPRRPAPLLFQASLFHAFSKVFQAAFSKPLLNWLPAGARSAPGGSGAYRSFVRVSTEPERSRPPPRRS